MNVKSIDKNNFPDYSDYIPEEFWDCIDNEKAFAYGADFSDTPAGAILWFSEDDSNAELRSIFVAPEYRRLGVGTELISPIRDRKICFCYEELGDKVSIRDFLAAVGIESEELSFGYGELTVGEAMRHFAEANIDSSKEYGCFYEELSRTEKKAVREFLEKRGEYSGVYERNGGDSLFYISKNKVRAAILLSEGEDMISCDYVFFEKGKMVIFFGMLARAAKHLKSRYDENERISFYLSTDDGRKLYEKLFEPIRYEVPIVTDALIS